jgi:hypothetical protein
LVARAGKKRHDEAGYSSRLALFDNRWSSSLQSLCGDPQFFVDRDFSRDVKPALSMLALQAAEKVG